MGDRLHGQEPTAKELRLVIAASSAGTVFEWYDFFIYGTLAYILKDAFYDVDNDTLGLLLVWSTFAVGFAFRPIGAILFGFLGDRLGRKYTFLVTVTLMGIATAGVGMIPTVGYVEGAYGSAWIVAVPILVILLRIMQGLALGGEYGGAAIYVAEHAPPEKRGFYTGFIQASVVGGFVLSIAVILLCRAILPEEQFTAEGWGWRVPFLLSIILLAVSLWMRLKLSESPVFQAMREAGETSGNPFVESFTYPGNKKRILVAFGVTGVLTTIWYTAFFSGLGFLRGPMRLDETLVEWLLLLAGLISMSFYVIVGRWSDRVGRKKPIVIGAVAALALLFPIFWGMGALANPGLARTAAEVPVVVSGPECRTDPFADLFDRAQSDCGKVLETLTANGVAYSVTQADDLAVTAADTTIALDDTWFAANEGASSARAAGLQAALTDRGFDFSRQVPPLPNLVGILFLLLGLGVLSALTYGSVAALLTEMFPAKIRYSSMSIPYHFGAGYLGGFLPLIAGIIVARTGNVYAGLWYTMAVVAVGLVIVLWGVKSGPPRDFDDSGKPPPVSPAAP